MNQFPVNSAEKHMMTAPMHSNQRDTLSVIKYICT